MNSITNLVPPVRATYSGDRPIMEAREFLIFRLGEQDYGIDVRNVRELCHYDTLTRIADGPRLIEGVVISRGEIMPLVDMRIHFNPGAPLYENLTEIIVLTMADRSVCMAVDGVSDVVVVNPEQVKPVPQTASLFNMGLTGWAECDQRDVLLLDIDKVLLGSGIGSQPKIAA